MKDLDKKIAALDRNIEHEKRIGDLENEVSRLNTALKDLRSQNGNNIVNKCKICDERFEGKRKLRDHTSSKHPIDLKCQICNEKFEQTYALELHLKTHEGGKFKCKICQKSFSMKWRFVKHEQAHSMTNVKFCHYFNNRKRCPYEEIGCMFQHKESQRCRYQNLCNNKLCQFQHIPNEQVRDVSKIDQNKPTVEDVNSGVKTDSKSSEPNEEPESQPRKFTFQKCFRYIYTEEALESHKKDCKSDLNAFNMFVTDLDSEEEEEDLECDDCGKVSENFDEYIEHRGMGGCAFYCDHCEKTSRTEIEMKKHLERHCNNCSEEFDNVSDLNLHKKKC